MKTKTFADFQICISVHLNLEDIFLVDMFDFSTHQRNTAHNTYYK